MKAEDENGKNRKAAREGGGKNSEKTAERSVVDPPEGRSEGLWAGIASLLEGVARLGSLRKSAADMDMSYSKAWTMIKNCERELGISLLNKKIGGKGGGGADLTGEAESLLKRYRAFEREASIRLDTLAGKYFPDI